MLIYNRKDVQSRYVELKVRLTSRGKGTVLFGQGIDVSTGRVIDKCNASQKMPSIETQIPFAERIVINKVEAKFIKMTAPPRKKEVIDIEIGIYSKAFEECEDTKVLHKPNWNDATFNMSLTYFVKNVLPRLDYYGYDIDLECISRIQEELIQKAVISKRGKMDYNTAKYSISNQMFRCDYIYKKLREYSPKYKLPSIDLEITGVRRKVHNDLAKALPNKIRIMFARLLFRLVKTKSGGLAMALGLMLFAGPRTAESAAVYFYQIQYSDSYAVTFICQQEKNRRAVKLLKTENAYRCIVLPKILIDLLENRKAYLISLGYNAEYIEQLPITFSGGDPAVLESSQEISALGKKLLKLCGCSNNFLLPWYSLMSTKPDVVDNDKLDDICAYVLRRDFATRACNICGLRPDQVDYLLGHAVSSKLKKDYLTSDGQSNVAWCLERYIFNPNHSNNPGFSPIPITHGSNLNLQANQDFMFVLSEPESVLDVEITFESMEAMDSVSIITTANITSNIECIERQDTPSLRRIRQIIGESIPKGAYGLWINEANKINIEEKETIKI